MLIAGSIALSFGGSVAAGLEACVAQGRSMLAPSGLARSTCMAFFSAPGSIVAHGNWLVEIYPSGRCGVGQPLVRSATAGDNNALGGSGAVLQDAIAPNTCPRAEVVGDDSFVALGAISTGN